MQIGQGYVKISQRTWPHELTGSSGAMFSCTVYKAIVYGHCVHGLISKKDILVHTVQ